MAFFMGLMGIFGKLGFFPWTNSTQMLTMTVEDVSFFFLLYSKTASLSEEVVKVCP